MVWTLDSVVIGSCKGSCIGPWLVLQL